MWACPPERTNGLDMPPTEARYKAYLASQMTDWDKVESFSVAFGTPLIYVWAWARGLVAHYPVVFLYWLLLSPASALIPGVVAVLAPALYRRHREPVVIVSKLLAAALYPHFRLAWHAPGSPPDALAAVGGIPRLLPMHPIALVQTGAVLMVVASIRHSLRFKAQLLCQLVLFFSIAQSEQLARRLSSIPGQHLVSASQATWLQVVCGLVLPLAHHYQFDRQRRAQWAAQEQRQAQQQRA